MLGVIQQLGASVRRVELQDDAKKGRSLTVDCELPAGLSATRVGDLIAKEDAVFSVDW